MVTSCTVLHSKFEVMITRMCFVLLFFYSLWNNDITDDAVDSLMELLKTLKDLKELK